MKQAREPIQSKRKAAALLKKLLKEMSSGVEFYDKFISGVSSEEFRRYDVPARAELRAVEIRSLEALRDAYVKGLENAQALVKQSHDPKEIGAAVDLLLANKVKLLELMKSRRDSIGAELHWRESLTAHIDWEALREEAEQVPLITELERVKLIIRLANGDQLAARDWCALMGTKVSEYTGPGTQGHPSVLESTISAMRVLADPPGKDTPVVIESTNDFVSGRVAQIPYLSSTRGRIVVRYQIKASSVVAALSYGVFLFADPGRPFGRRLCYCHYDKCGRFFLAAETQPGEVRRKGRQERKYCPGGECRKAQVKIQTRKRVAKSRRSARLAGAFAEREYP